LATNTANILTKQPLITTATDLDCNSITASDKYFYEANEVVKAFGLYGSTLHYYQVEDDLNTFINSGVIEGDTIMFPAGSLAGNILMEDVRSVSFVGIPNGTNFSGTMDIATTLTGGNRSCRFENITFDGLVVIQGPRMGHIFRNCEFSVGLTLTGLVSAGNYDIQFIDCIIRGLTLSETYFSVYGGSFFRRCNFKYQSINALQSNTVDVILEDCINIPDDLETISPNYFVNGSAQYVNDHYYLHTGKKFYLTNNFVDLTPTLDNELTSKSYVDTQINTKQDIITSATDLVSGSITASGVNINTTLADILSRLELLENP